MNSPLISIITPAFNVDQYLIAAADSISSQTYSNWEWIIVVDSASSDNTLSVARGLAENDKRIKVFLNVGGIGVSSNRNLALEKATGKFLAFFDADDLMHSEKLERQVKFMQSNNCMLSYHSIQPFDQNGFRKIRAVPNKVNREYILSDNVLSCISVMMAQNLLGDVRFRDGIPHEDFVFWCNLFEKIDYALGIKDVLAYYRIRNESRSANKFRAAMGRWTVLRDILHIHFLKSLRLFFIYAVKSITKRLA